MAWNQVDGQKELCWRKRLRREEVWICPDDGYTYPQRGFPTLPTLPLLGYGKSVRCREGTMQLPLSIPTLFNAVLY